MASLLTLSSCLSSGLVHHKKRDPLGPLGLQSCLSLMSLMHWSDRVEWVDWMVESHAMEWVSFRLLKTTPWQKNVSHDTQTIHKTIKTIAILWNSYGIPMDLLLWLIWSWLCSAWYVQLASRADGSCQHSIYSPSILTTFCAWSYDMQSDLHRLVNMRIEVSSWVFWTIS